MANSIRRRKPRELGRSSCGGGRLPVLLVALLAFGLATTSGCTRRFFRRAADKEVDQILAEKDIYPAWKIDQWHVYPDPRSRFADPTNPDRPPMPPDDAAAYALSPKPQWPGPAGVAWVEGTGYLAMLAEFDKENRAKLAEREETAEPKEAQPPGTLPVGEVKSADERAREIENQIQHELNPPVSATRGLPADVFEAEPPNGPKPYLLNMDQVVELAFINSREFQTVREQLYLAALPVTASRFSFAAQPFLAEQIIRERSGRQSADGETNRWLAGTNTGFTKLFSTGALLLFNFANQTVYNLGSGPVGTVSVSNIDLDFIQPLLRGGGRAVTLEPLTQAERNLLYSIRDYYRFRQEYFVFFAAGQPQFIPGVTPGVPAIQAGTVSGLGPFVPVASPLPTVAGNPATPQVVPGQGGLQTPTPSTALTLITPQGYIATVGEKASLTNSYKNIQSLQRYLRFLQVQEEGGIVNRVQVGQVEQTLLSAIQGVLTSQVGYRVSLDQLKQQMGLPMSINLDVDDAPLRPLIQLVRRSEDVAANYELAYFTFQGYGALAEAPQLRARARRLFTTTPLVRGTRFARQILARWKAWEDIPPAAPNEKTTPLDRRLDSLAAERDRLTRAQRRAASRGETFPEADERRLGELTFEIALGEFERALRYYESLPWRNIKDPARQQALQATIFRLLQRNFLNLIEEPVTEQRDKIRELWPPLPALCVNGVDLWSADENTAVTAITQASLANRLDLMNQRAQVVDAWRKIAVAANALLGTFNVQYHLDASSPAGQANPFGLGGSRTRNELIMNGQLPLVRILERNNYRSTLIGYQQARRNLMLFEDDVVFSVRFDYRQLRALGNNYQRVQKRNVELAYFQVDQALQAFSQPQAPPQQVPPQDIAGLLGPTAARPTIGDPAALTLQLLNTQSFLLNAQNTLYTTWVGILTTRMNLYRDLGIMPLNSRGVWIDDVATCQCQPSATEQPGAEPAAGERPAGRDGGRPEQLPEPRTLTPPPGAALEQKR